MSTYTPAQLARIAAGAGFRGNALVAAVAVALAESGGNPAATHTNMDTHRSRDRGLWQINSYWHKEVPDAQAFNPAGNAAAAYRISKAGADWRAWTTWRTGVAQAQLARARLGVAQASSSTPATAQPADWTFPGIPGLIPPVPGIPSPGDIDDELKAGLAGAGAALPWADPLTGALGGAVDGITSPLDSVKTGVAVLVKAGAWVSDSHNWVRVGLVAGGTIGVLIALGMIAKTGAAGDTASGAVSAAGKAASMAVPVGKALKSVKAVA